MQKLMKNEIEIEKFIEDMKKLIDEAMEKAFQKVMEEHMKRMGHYSQHDCPKRKRK